jgi:hypothetical protein
VYRIVFGTSLPATNDDQDTVDSIAGEPIHIAERPETSPRGQIAAGMQPAFSRLSTCDRLAQSIS